MRDKINLDKLGICTSAFCAVHCLITPFILLFFPMAGLAFLESEGLEIGILVLSFFIAVASLVVSYFRKHGNARPLVLAVFGFVLFIIGKVSSLEVAEIICSVIGGLFVVMAHYLNIKLTRKIALK